MFQLYWFYFPFQLLLILLKIALISLDSCEVVNKIVDFILITFILLFFVLIICLFLSLHKNLLKEFFIFLKLKKLCISQVKLVPLNIQQKEEVMFVICTFVHPIFSLGCWSLHSWIDSPLSTSWTSLFPCSVCFHTKAYPLPALGN